MVLQAGELVTLGFTHVLYCYAHSLTSTAQPTDQHPGCLSLYDARHQLKRAKLVLEIVDLARSIAMVQRGEKKRSVFISVWVRQPMRTHCECYIYASLCERWLHVSMQLATRVR